MTVIELAALVDRMRVAQRAYFRTRKPDILEECKQLEHQVDQAVKGLLDQPTLFDEQD